MQPPDARPEEFGWAFSNGSKYIIKWFQGPAAPHVSGMTISKNTEPSTENDTEGITI